MPEYTRMGEDLPTVRIGGTRRAIVHTDGVRRRRQNLKHNDKVVFQADKFTRGLAICDSFVVVGGSDVGERRERIWLRGAVYVLTQNFALLAAIDMRGMVQEIRIFSHVDYGLGNNAIRSSENSRLEEHKD